MWVLLIVLCSFAGALFGDWLIARWLRRRQRQLELQAEAEFLDRVATEHGIKRKPGETNDELRARLTRAVRLGGRTGTRAAIELAVCNADGVRAYYLIEQPGELVVYVFPFNEHTEATASVALMASVAAGVSYSVRSWPPEVQ